MIPLENKATDKQLLYEISQLLKEIRDDLKILKEEHIVHFDEWRQKNVGSE